MTRMKPIDLVAYMMGKRYVTITSISRRKLVISSTNLTQVTNVLIDRIAADTGHRPQVVIDPAETLLIFETNRRKEATNEN